MNLSGDSTHLTTVKPVYDTIVYLKFHRFADHKIQYIHYQLHRLHCLCTKPPVVRCAKVENFQPAHLPIQWCLNRLQLCDTNRLLQP